ncbi:MAG: hypothetical protein JXA57_15210 [Armatimonadetes bacterium]|nr:hypothetical protein [Armatimonadota bacterium]
MGTKNETENEQVQDFEEGQEEYVDSGDQDLLNALDIDSDLDFDPDDEFESGIEAGAENDAGHRADDSDDDSDQGGNSGTDAGHAGWPDDELLSRAEALGIPREDARGLTDLPAVVGLLEKQQVRQGQQQDQQESQQVDGKGEGDGIDVLLDPEQYDPEVASVVNKLGGTLKELRGQLSAMETRLRRADEEAFLSRIDAHFAGLGEEYHEFVGTGALSSLGAESDQYKARMAVLEGMAIRANGLVASGKPLPPEQELLAQELQAQFGAKLATARAQRDQQQKRQRTTNRPTHHERPQGATPEDRAAAHFDQRLRELGGGGYDDVDGTGEEEDF